MASLLIRAFGDAVGEREGWKRMSCLGLPGRGARRLVLLMAFGVGVVTIGVDAPAASAPTRPGGTAVDVIPGSYIVALQTTPAIAAVGVDAVARDLVAPSGGQVVQTFEHSLVGFEASLSATAAEQLADNPQVRYVEPNQVVRVSDTALSPPSWGLDRIDQRALPLTESYAYPSTGSSVHAYVIDTGIRFSHTDFGGRATSGYDFFDNDDDASDCEGHGTHVAGTVGGTDHGVAKATELVAVKVFGCDGTGSNANVIAGIDWVTANAVHPAVANLSLGGGVSQATDDAVTALIDSGVSAVVAAGNDTVDACAQSPARLPAAITVAASDINDVRAWFSNFGTCVDLFAPGVDITSATFTSDTATEVVSGTSQATPHVAGVAALLLDAHPTWTPQDVTNEILANATVGAVADPLGSPNRLLFGETGCFGGNGVDTPIPDGLLGLVGPPIFTRANVTGCDRSASASSAITVHIEHEKRGDLVIDLIAPDGTSYRLKNPNLLDFGNDVHVTYFRNLSAEPGNGLWRLRVQDTFLLDQGFQDNWTFVI